MTVEIDPAEAAARSFYNANGGSYEVPAGAPVTLPSTPGAAPPVLLPEPAAAPAAEAPPPPVDEDFYAPVLTRGLVEWEEPVAAPEEFELRAPPGVLDTSEAGTAAMTRLRDGLAAAGAGVTLARELFSDAVQAQTDPRWSRSREMGEAELRQHYGERYDAKIEAARGLVQRAAQRCPEIVDFLERTGLGNSPDFIRKLASAAGRRGR